jgi:hypothetical protein
MLIKGRDNADMFIIRDFSIKGRHAKHHRLKSINFALVYPIVARFRCYQI